MTVRRFENGQKREMNRLVRITEALGLKVKTSAPFVEVSLAGTDITDSDALIEKVEALLGSGAVSRATLAVAVRAATGKEANAAPIRTRKAKAGVSAAGTAKDTAPASETP